MTDQQPPPDWVLIEAAKRSYSSNSIDFIRNNYGTMSHCFRALCDMIAKYEQPPVDRKVLCAREALSHGSPTLADGITERERNGKAVPDWVQKRAEQLAIATTDIGEIGDKPNLLMLSAYRRALCDMIAKYETEPVDRKLLCAREAFKMFGENPSPRFGAYVPVELAHDYAVRAIELWIEGYGE